MAGHPLLISKKNNRSLLCIQDRIFEIELSYYMYNQVDGYLFGLKFSDETGSMDLSKKSNIYARILARAIGDRAVSILRADLNEVTLFGFYLLTEDLSARSNRAVSLKRRVYGDAALGMHREINKKLPYINELEAKGGIGWAMSEYQFDSYTCFKEFEHELEKTVSIFPCE